MAEVAMEVQKKPRRVSATAEVRKSFKKTVGSVVEMKKHIEFTLEDLKRMGRKAMVDSLTELDKMINMPPETKHTRINKEGQEEVVSVRSNLPIKIAAINSNTNVNRLLMEMDERENGKGKGNTVVVFGEENRIESDGTTTQTKSVTVKKTQEVVPEEVIQEYQNAALEYLEDDEIDFGTDTDE